MLDFNFEGALFPDIFTLLAQWIATLILFLVFVKFLYKPVLNFLDKRNLKMQEDLLAAQTERDLALEQHQKSLVAYQEAVTTSQQLVEESRRKAQNISTEMMKEAKSKANYQVEMAHLQIEDERQAMMKDVQDEVVEVALYATQKLLEKEVDESSQRLAIQQIIAQLRQ